MFRRFTGLRRLHNTRGGYWSGAASRWSSSSNSNSHLQDHEAVPPQQPDDNSPPAWQRPPVPMVRSIIESLIAIRKTGERITDHQEHELYKLYRHFLKGGNCSQVDHSICHLFQTIPDDDLKSMRKLTRRLERKEWYGIAYQVQRIIASQITGTRAIKSYKRLAELATKNRDFDKAALALEEAQSRIVEMLLEKAQAVEDTDLDKALQLYQEAYDLSSNIDKVEVAFKFSTLLLRRLDTKAAAEKLEKSMDSLKLATQMIIANKGMVPKYMVPKVEALPSWKQRIEERLAEIKKTVEKAAI